MPTTNFARTERIALADLLGAIGPDQPTLCTGWQTRDLAAHLVIRDRRPDAAAGIVIRGLAARTKRIQDAAATRPWTTLVDQVRNPPALSPAGFGPLDRVTNTTEFFVHHEDVRRARPGWSPRELPEGLARALAGQVRLVGKLRLRRFPGRVTITMPGYGEPIVTGTDGGDLTLTGAPGEMALLFAGRRTVARVEVGGPDDLIAALASWKLGL